MNTRTAPTMLTGIGHVELRVRNLDSSSDFYCRLFGMARQPATPPSNRVCKCVGVSVSGGEAFSVVLTEGFPPGTEIAGLDHVCFNVPDVEHVDGVYALANHLGVRCTTPRVLDGNYQTFVFDPNGYKIEIVASSGVSSRGIGGGS